MLRLFPQSARKSALLANKGTNLRPANNIINHRVSSLLSVKHRHLSTYTYPRIHAEKKANVKKLPLWNRIKSYSTFTASGVLIVGATGISAIVIYLIVTELFSPSGDTQLFNRAVSLVEKDEIVRSKLQCHDTIIRQERLKAYGELVPGDKWTRNRPISSSKKLDRQGKEHYFMRFHVESKEKIGLAHLEAIESDKRYKPDFLSLYIDIPGEQRYYLIKPRMKQIIQPRGFLGFNWGSKK
ncbi:hypothetical protein TPHA_0K01260 [Tetrapisispora phaffii CBS 4417]|uniref:Mitochondrial import inner membrane translocase subunit Tim21 n=1 Tax=Tetrapisispora phaffii (strain ATCC 24235 / CBS 4417 / NBRC 1672 / NRRL Y-8282 / UCD 70-5) TaxID=1071381 RepID=G8BZD2_TETPH|nr:hypothetical protein TPHA_0K01260 [Tetrapisispora phaffii CBS 4417]CCE65260.1 hypothetical protein TPHA_0K01260 [Tetrapisispora phaffii CBS 4417]